MSIVLPSPPTYLKMFDDKTGKIVPQWKQWWDIVYNRLGGATAGFAPDTAPYIVMTPTGDLDGEFALSTLSSGFLKVVTGTGALTSTSNNLIQDTDLSLTSVSPGTYSINGTPYLTVNSTGRVTFAANVTVSVPPSPTGNTSMARTFMFMGG